MKVVFAAIALFAIASAFTTRHHASKFNTQYGFRSTESIPGGVRYHLVDLTNLTEGPTADYVCNSTGTCKIEVSAGTPVSEGTNLIYIDNPTVSNSNVESGTFTFN